MNQTEAPTETTLVLRRTFDAPRERVFAAWTQPDILREWFKPGDHTLPEMTMDVREGGRYRIVFKDPDGELLAVDGSFREIRPPAHLSMTWSWEEDDAALARDTLLSLDFHDAGGKTELVLTHSNFRDAQQRDNHNGGWSSMLDKLAATFAK